MADDKSKRDFRDRDRVAADEDAAGTGVDRHARN